MAATWSRLYGWASTVVDAWSWYIGCQTHWRAGYGLLEPRGVAAESHISAGALVLSQRRGDHTGELVAESVSMVLGYSMGLFHYAAISQN